MASDKKIRVLLAKPGLDGHDRGVKVLTLGLRDEGMDVVYTGLRKTAEEIVKQAAEEKVDVIGLSTLTGSHKTLFPEVVRLAKENNMGNILIIGGGLIPQEDIPDLQKAGIKGVFGPATLVKEIADYIRANVSK